MANRHKGEASIRVRDRDYVLVFDVNAMCEVEYILDAPTDTILRTLATGRPPLHVVRALLWGGLRARHPDIDLHGAGGLIEDMGGAGAALEGVGQALMNAFPEAEEGAEPDRPRKGAAAGTGRRSSRRGSEQDKTPKRSGGRPRE